MEQHVIEANDLDQAAFTAKYGHLFECSPWIAETAWHNRPFDSMEELLQRMKSIVLEADEASKLELLRAHPELGAKVIMTDESIQEQFSAGLNRLHRDEAFVMQQMNKKYRERFGFPFIMAVRGLTPELIADAMQKRMNNTTDEELETALQEVFKIASIRAGHM